MAREIVTWCDLHLEDRETNVPGSVREFRLDGADTELDLCDECWDALTGDLRTLVGSVGRVNGKQRKRKRAQEERPPSQTGRLDCPKGCGTTFVGKSGVNSHLQARHGTTLATVETEMGVGIDGASLDYECPDGCGLRFTTPNGATTHAARTHRKT